MKTLFLLLLTAFLMACTHPVTPTVTDPGGIAVDAQLGAPLLLANGQSTVYARIRLTTLPRPERPRGPVNVALAIDTSGSMEGTPIEQARKAAVEMIDALRDGDRLAVVAFHTRTEILLPSTELDGEARAQVKKRVSEMQARGTTDMSGGLDAAIGQVQANATAKGINRVILLGDGIPNNPSPIEPSARRALESGIGITTLGLGLDYDETLMGKIAAISGGRYRYIESADKVAGLFREELQRIDTVYARHATAALTAGPGVRIDAVVGDEDRSPGSTAYVTLGDIARGDTRDILVRMTVTPRKAGVPIELLDAMITFDDALENAGRLERHVYLGAHTVAEEAKVAAAKNVEIELSAALAEASATTLRALALAKDGHYVRAREMLQKGSAAAQAQAGRTPSAELSKHATDMEAVAKDMPAADQPKASPSSDGYEFQDDAEMPSVKPAPAAVQRRKEVHQKAFEALH